MAGMIRAATHADIPRLVELRASVRENRLSDPTAVTIADYVWFIDHAAVHVWDDGCIRGFSAGDPRDGSIWALFVDPDFEGRGIGQALIGAACMTLRAAGHQAATLSTQVGSRAERFYRRNGWVSRELNAKGEYRFARSLVR